MNFNAEMAVFLLELLIGTWLFLSSTERRKRFWVRLSLGLVLSYGICEGCNMALSVIPTSSTLVTNMFRYLIAFTMIVLTVWFSFDVTIWEALFSSSSGYAIQNIYHYLFIILLAISESMESLHRIAICNWTALLLAYGLAYIFTRRYLKMLRTHTILDVKSIIPVSLLVLFFTVVLSEQVPLVADNSMMDYMLYYLYSLCCPLLVLFLQYGLYEKYRLMGEKEIITQMLLREKRQHKLSEDSIALINMKCHDLKHQLNAYCQAQRIDSKTAKEIEQTIQLYDAVIDTGNPAVDIVLTEKMFRCEQAHIELSCILDGHVFDFMAESDIYSMFGNALDNAIESVLQEAEEHRFITLKTGHQGNLVFLHMENFCSKILTFEDGLPLTTKKDEPGYHGYGVKSIRFLSEKYGGYANIYTKDSLFILDIFFPASV